MSYKVKWIDFLDSNTNIQNLTNYVATFIKGVNTQKDQHILIYASPKNINKIKNGILGLLDVTSCASISPNEFMFNYGSPKFEVYIVYMCLLWTEKYEKLYDLFVGYSALWENTKGYSTRDLVSNYMYFDDASIYTKFMNGNNNIQ
jgi:hypothetical protein